MKNVELDKAISIKRLASIKIQLSANVGHVVVLFDDGGTPDFGTCQERLVQIIFLFF